MSRALWTIPSASGWTPSDLGSALKLWLRADMGVTLNGSTVSAWADQSGNANNATQGTASAQPTYTAAGDGNGRPSVRFDGTNDYLTISPGAAFGTTAAAFVIANHQGAAVTSQRNLITLDLDPASGGGSGYALSQYIGTSPAELRVLAEGAAWGSASGIDLSDNAVRLMELRRTSSTAASVSVGSSSTAVSSVSASTSTGTSTRLGCGHYANAVAFWRGDVHEVVVVNRALTTAERAALWQYTRVRYAL